VGPPLGYPENMADRTALACCTTEPAPKRSKAGPSGGATSDGGHAGGFQLVSKDGDPLRRKIRIEYITDKSRRHITFSKRKSGIMKKVNLRSR
jgi:hypothetical protein